MDDLTAAQFSVKDDILYDMDNVIRILQNSQYKIEKAAQMLIDIEKQIKEL